MPTRKPQFGASVDCEVQKLAAMKRIESARDRGAGIRLSADEVSALFYSRAVDDDAADAIPRVKLDVKIRWILRRDMPEVLRIEQQSFEAAWTEEDFLCCFGQRNCIGMVAEHDHQVVGFMIYELHKSRINLLNFAVATELRRHGIGSQMVLRLVDKLSQQRRKEILLKVRERNLEAQLFFKQQNFRAIRVVSGYYDDTCEDAIVMKYLIGTGDQISSAI